MEQILEKKETKALRQRLVDRTIKDIKCYRSLSGDSYIKIETDKGSVVIGANDLGIWLASEDDVKNG